MKIKKIKNNFKFGLYVLDPFTNEKQFHIKGIKSDDVDKIFKEMRRKYK